MLLKIYPDYPMLSRAAADLIVRFISKKKNSLICLASGHTPLGVFQCLVEDAKNKKVDFSQCTFVSLDEWLGIDPKQAGSCREMMDRGFFQPLQWPEKHIRFFDGSTATPEKDCEAMNEFIASHGGLDIMLVGVGTNGHIAMNEPGTSFDAYAHVSILAEETKNVGQKYFTSSTELSKGLTLGLRHLRESRLPIIMASGGKKAAIMKQAMTHAPAESLPVSIHHLIDHGYFMMDSAAQPLNLKP